MKRGRPPHADILTPREWEVLRLLRRGFTNEQIAVELGISFSAAKFHVSEILSRLGVENREEAVKHIDSQRRHWAVTMGGFLPALLAKTARPSVLTLSSLAIIAVVIIAIMSLSISGRGINNQAVDQDLSMLAADFGLEVERERIVAGPQKTWLSNSILLTMIEPPADIGDEAEVLSGIKTVHSLAELRRALNPQIDLIIVDKSASGELAGTDFLAEQFDGGRALVGLNVCLADFPSSQSGSLSGAAWEVSPSGTIRHTNAEAPSSRCGRLLEITAGYDYYSFIVGSPRSDEQLVRGPGANAGSIFNGSCEFRLLLVRLDGGKHDDLFPIDCEP
jgi:DNA-binding CsgD family transcriptional regulator